MTKSKLKKLLAAPMLGVEDYDKKAEENAVADLKGEWQAEPSEVDRFKVLIAYESVGCWGCDSSAWFLLIERATGNLFEAHGSHCSCYGFEGQFKPELTSEVYLKSPKFSISCGGYDNDPDGNQKKIQAWINENL
jgi:hypothetical protein